MEIPKIPSSIISSIPFYAMMSAMDKMGISPDLLGRQTAVALTPVLQDLAKKVAADRSPKNINEYVQMFKVLVGDSGMADLATLRVES